MPNIRIQGLDFDVEDTYAEGHTLTANEAAALNQTRRENLGNNFRSKIDAAKKDAGEGVELSEEVVAQLAEDFAALAASYEFGVRRGGTSRSPIERESRRLAKDVLDKAIRAKYGKLSAVAEDVYEAKLDELSRREDIVAAAQANLDNAAGIDLGL